MLSVIIPVYNSKSTLNRCIESVIHQNYNDMEVIIVDDGSVDGSQTLCDSWLLKDNRIRVIHKDNGGLSDARNAGIELAEGDHITFVDSDDYLLEPITLASLMTIIKQHPEYDILEYPIYWHFGNKKEQRIVNFNSQEYTNISEDYWYANKGYEHTYACNKIFHRRMFDDARFPKGKKFEDVYLMLQIMKKAKVIATTNIGLYYYVDNPLGITRMANGKDLNDLLSAHLLVIQRDINGRLTKNADFIDYYLHVLNIQLDVVRMLNTKPLLPIYKLSVFGLIGKVELKSLLKYIILKYLGINILCKIITTKNRIWERH